MKCVILCGGFGTRFSEETDLIPKPMIKISDKPVLEHIMDCYSRFGFNEFILCAGYKFEVIQDYFLKYNQYQSDFRIDLGKNEVKVISKKTKNNWKIWVVDTGLKSQTAHRLYKIRKFINKNENFFMTYGDGVSNVNIKKLLAFHIKNKKIATMTIVRPQARFGHLELKGNLIQQFKEKDQTSEGWINGGFFVLSQKVFDFIGSKRDLIFERQPLETLAKKKQLIAFKHTSFWHPMDTLRDKRFLEKVYKGKKSPWLI